MTAVNVKPEHEQSGRLDSESGRSEVENRRPRGRLWAALNPDADWRGSSPWASAATQVALFLLASLLYFGVRNLTRDQAPAAFKNARRIVEFERSLGLNFEADAQSMILESDLLIAFFNWVYMFLHWPVILVALIYTFLRRRGEYVLYRNAIIVSGLIGLVFFALYPVAPPRLFDTSQFFDSVAELSRSYEILQPKSVVNQFAAMPSFHVGWNVLAGVAVYRSASSRIVRFLAVLSPLLMTFAVVLTANHWVVDVFAGTGIALLGLAGAALLNHFLGPRRVEAPS